MLEQDDRESEWAEVRPEENTSERGGGEGPALSCPSFILFMHSQPPAAGPWIGRLSSDPAGNTRRPASGAQVPQSATGVPGASSRACACSFCMRRP
jgi:hypothetical protein